LPNISCSQQCKVCLSSSPSINRYLVNAGDFSAGFLGLLHARQGRLEEARMALRRAAELDPEDERAAGALKRLKGGG
jgi:Flp pilus assembly protein TadD